MSTRFALFASTCCLMAALAGCGKKPPEETAPAAPAPSSGGKVSVGDQAPEAPAPPPPPPPDAAAAPADPAPQEEKIDDLTRITRAIQSFSVSYERPPKDLNELVKNKLLPSLPVAPPGKKFLYDPSHMSIKLVNQ